MCIMNIAIVEDQKKDAEVLSSYLDDYAYENDITINIKLYPDGLGFLSDYKCQFDIIFMDIHMPFVDGMATAAKLRESDPKVVLVFVTNMTQYAIKGYEVSASDFLVKPLTYSVFRYKIKRIFKLASRKVKGNILIVNKAEKKRVSAEDIDYIEVVGHKCIYHINGDKIESWDTLANIYKALEPFDFCYCNSCYLVNLNKVESVDKDFVVVSGDKLKISRPKKKEFIRRLLLSMSGRG